MCPWICPYVSMGARDSPDCAIHSAKTAMDRCVSIGPICVHRCVHMCPWMCPYVSMDVSIDVSQAHVFHAHRGLARGLNRVCVHRSRFVSRCRASRECVKLCVRTCPLSPPPAPPPNPSLTKLSRETVPLGQTKPWRKHGAHHRARHEARRADSKHLRHGNTQQTGSRAAQSSVSALLC